MPAQLLALNDGPSIMLDKPILLIGRDPECDIQLDSRKISRQHCCIAQVHDYFVIRDLGSTNGIRINGVRVLEGKLKDQDELMIGGHKYQVCWDAPAPRARSRPPVVRADDDSLLEKYDQPVPLADPEESLPMDGSDASRRPPPLPASPRPVLPDQLDLAPPSGTKPPRKSPNG